MFHVPNLYRVRHGRLASDDYIGEAGAFEIRRGTLHAFAIASDAAGWEHVSVSLPEEKRCPTWEEMCQIKALFWDDTDTVIQFHPPASEYVNNHPYCLHLWRSTTEVISLPPSDFVGMVQVA